MPRHLPKRTLSALLIAPLLAILTAPPAPAARPAEFVWPKKDLVDGGILVRYQPEIEAWRGYAVLEVRMPVSFRRQGERRRTYGAIRVRALTEVDRASGTVSLKDPWISEASFPSLDKELTDKAVAWLQEHFPRSDMVMPLERLLHTIEDQRSMSYDVDVSHEPPRLFRAKGESLLVLLDGEPVMEAAGRSGLQIVVNTDSALLFHPASDTYFLLHGDAWLSSRSLMGRWSAAGELPGAFRALPREGLFGQLRRQVPGRALGPDEVPQVFVSKREAEVVESDGEAEWRSIPGTGLMYLANSSADVFMDSRGGKTYALFSGRWYRSDAEGRARAEYVPDDELPAGFREIPADHPKGHVLASIPGTVQAQEAVMAAHIPRFKRVKRGEARFNSSFIGAADFQPIGSTGVEFAANTSQDVFRIRNRYYALSRGVWFESAFATGPWKLADQIPREIYTIPPTHPKHHVAYTRVVASGEGEVLAGILPGYMGTFVSDGRVVHGVGTEVHRSPDFWRHAFQRRQEWWKQAELRADVSGRPFHLEPFFQRSFGFHFQYDPNRAQFLPRRHRFQRKEAPPPPTTAPPPTRPPTRRPRPTSIASVAPPEMRVGGDGTLYRRLRSGWQKLVGGGWVHSGAPPPGTAGVRVGTMGRLPPRKVPEAGASPAGKASVWPPPRKPDAKKPKMGKVARLKAPKVAEGFDKYRWTNTYAAPYRHPYAYGGYNPYYGYGGYRRGFGGYYGYYGPTFSTFSRGVVGPSRSSGARPAPSFSTNISPSNMPSTYRNPAAGRPSLQPIIKTGGS